MAQQGVLVAYKGETIMSAAASGNLPLCVLLWGMGSAKQINLMVAVDEQGNNPFHHAVRAQSTDVMAFFNQQTGGMLTPDKRLVDTTNKAGDTPLLRALPTGCMTVIKALIDEKSDVCHSNNAGENVFHICVKESQLWTLNYIHHHICKTLGNEKATEMLQAVDKDDMGLVEHAAQAGDVNIMEFLIRKGLNICRVHPTTGQTPLHMAVSRHRLELARFLLSCGCSPYILDKDGLSVLQYHNLRQDSSLRTGISQHPAVSRFGLRCFSTKNESLQDEEKGRSGSVKLSESGRSFAIDCKIRSNLLMVMLYGAIVFGLLLLPLALPFWIYFPLLGIVGFVYKRFSDQVASLRRRAKHARGRIILTTFQEILGAEEKFPGLWLGSLLACLFFCFACMNYDRTGENSLNIVGVDSIDEEPALFYGSILCVFITITTWIKMVMLPPNPGLVDTRQEDFDVLLEKSIEVGGSEPNNSIYCRTSFVKKPVRTIGFGNHRTFMIFLYSHVVANIFFLAMLIKALIRANDKTGPAFVLGTLLSNNYFFVTFLLTYILVVTAGLTFLMVEQTSNIIRNVTTNERINSSRYAWMKGPDGRPFNRFNRGILTNVLEFLLVPGYTIDYYTIMAIPEAVRRSNKKNSSLQASTTCPTVNALHSEQQKSTPSHSNTPKEEISDKHL